MFKPTFLHDLATTLTDALPKELHTLKKDFEKTCHAMLTQTFQKLDLVTREEFDTQTKVLLRTRTKLEALEKQLEALEAKAKQKPRTNRDDI